MISAYFPLVLSLFFVAYSFEKGKLVHYGLDDAELGKLLEQTYNCLIGANGEKSYCEEGKLLVHTHLDKLLQLQNFTENKERNLKVESIPNNLQYLNIFEDYISKNK
jgi:hypothetical protein